MSVARREVVDRALAAVSGLSPTSRAVIAFHVTPSPEALESTLDVLDDVVGPFRRLDELLVDDRPGCALTFDDGDRSIIDVAAPVLHRRGVPATAYVVGGLIGTTDPFWWSEVLARAGDDGPRLVTLMKSLPQEVRLDVLDGLRRRTPDLDVSQPNLDPAELVMLEGMGVDVGNHSTTHPLLDRCDDATVEHELTETHRLLTGWLGHEPDSVAYPNGNVDERVVAVARDLGYRTGLLFDHRPLPRRVVDPLRIPRVRLDVGADEATVRARASGLHPRLHHLLGRP